MISDTCTISLILGRHVKSNIRLRSERLSSTTRILSYSTKTSQLTHYLSYLITLPNGEWFVGGGVGLVVPEEFGVGVAVFKHDVDDSFR